MSTSPLIAEASATFEFLEQNSHIIYPALAVLVLVMLGAAVANAWKHPEVAGVEKARLKGEIIRSMRNNIGWITAADLAARMEQDTHAMATLLEEMKQDGLLVTSMLDGKIHYRLKGT